MRARQAGAGQLPAAAAAFRRCFVIAHVLEEVRVKNTPCPACHNDRQAHQAASVVKSCNAAFFAPSQALESGNQTPAGVSSLCDASNGLQRAETLIRTLQLSPHPEGGWYREIFRSARTVQPMDGRPARAGLTSIDFLLTRGQQSAWHRVRSDEAWHWLEGGRVG
jgi:hypothetical protein